VRIVRAHTSEDWATYVADTLVARLQVNPALRLCLPTGWTPVPVYDRVAAAVEAGRVSFHRAEVFLLDEFGGVAPDDPGRCDQMLRHALLDRINLPPDRFHRFDLTGDIEVECAAFEAAIGSGCDLSLLGIGTNGHVGMNEPGSGPDTLTRRVELAAETTAATARYFRHDRLPTWGVTMGIATLMRSREVWLLASGRGKASIVRRIVREPVSTDVPATLLRGHEAALLIVDGEAGALVQDFP
jgi:glucosamine-6-phosphate deaminase